MTAQEGGRLADNLVHFARALRAAGIPVGPGAVLDALSRGKERRHRHARISTGLHAIFVKRHEHSLLFEQAFRIFLPARAIDQLLAAMLPQVPMPEKEKPAPGAQRVHEALLSARGEPERKPPELETDARLTVSDREVLQRKDFAQMTAAEIAAAKEAIKRLVLSLDEVRTRRLAPHRHGHLIDIRRTLRSSLKAGGAVIDLKYLGPRRKAPPVVALLDISGSMSQYPAFSPLHAVTDARRVYVLFGTRHRLAALKARIRTESLPRCCKRLTGRQHADSELARHSTSCGRAVLTQGAIVLLITDGLERDPDDRLAFEIDRVHRSCRRLIWLNPLLRFSGFEAKAKGIRAMLPHVDQLRPIHNLNSMAELVRALSAGGGPAGDPKAWLEKTWLEKAA
jgi:uncharacterized protein with von Willebrand factor type A (vWA) domain